MMPDFSNLLPSAKQKTSGEYAGACPACGGVDRFLIWPDGRKGFRYLCRGCGAKGDAIQFMREFRGLSFQDACRQLGLAVKQGPVVPAVPETFPGMSGNGSKKPEINPVEDDEAWQHAAIRLLMDAQMGLQSEAGYMALQARGLEMATGYYAGLGYLHQTRRESKKAWGLAGKGKPDFVIPAGLVIPLQWDMRIHSLTVRARDYAADRNWPPKYMQLAGSRNLSFRLEYGEPDRPVVLLESALDVILLWQWASDIVIGVAACGAGKPFDDDTLDFIRRAPAILACPDNDEGGARAWWLHWSKIFPSAKLKPAFYGLKDMGEMDKARRRGANIKDLRQWACEIVEHCNADSH